MGRASLKRVERACRGRLRRRFPGPMGRASLKPQPSLQRRVSRELISRPYGPGLIEAPAWACLIRWHMSDFPALWAGPH